MDNVRLLVCKDFSTAPGPRYRIEGLHSGQEFREEVLLPKLEEAILSNRRLTVDLDGTAGYGTSFLEEAFGGLIRENGYKLNELLQVLEFKSIEEDYLIDDIKEYLSDASKNAK